eukprot:4334431-Amphidinium_carterae.1
MAAMTQCWAREGLDRVQPLLQGYEIDFELHALVLLQSIEKVNYDAIYKAQPKKLADSVVVGMGCEVFGASVEDAAAVGAASTSFSFPSQGHSSTSSHGNSECPPMRSPHHFLLFEGGRLPKISKCWK